MKPGRWLLMTILASLTALLIFSSASGRGQSAVIFDYEVTNDDGILFADEYERLGGVDTLGHPASYRFTLGRWIHLPGDAESSAPVEARGQFRVPGQHIPDAGAGRPGRLAAAGEGNSAADQG